jgi:hypothetical protein
MPVPLPPCNPCSRLLSRAAPLARLSPKGAQGNSLGCSRPQEGVTPRQWSQLPTRNPERVQEGVFSSPLSGLSAGRASIPGLKAHLFPNVLLALHVNAHHPGARQRRDGGLSTSRFSGAMHRHRHGNDPVYTSCTLGPANDKV